MPQVSQSIPPYTPTGVEVSISRDKSWPYSAGHWAAACQAIIRSGVHKDQTDKGRALHPMYHSFHECPVDLKLKKELVDSTLEDAFDAVSTFKFAETRYLQISSLRLWTGLMVVYPSCFDVPAIQLRGILRQKTCQLTHSVLPTWSMWRECRSG